jgi:hypothetical protein
MSSELENRLDGILLEVPEPEPEAGERALARALSALAPPVPRSRHRLRLAVVIVAAALLLLALAAGSLAAAGALHVTFGHPKRHAPVSLRALALPPGATGLAVVVDGRLSVVTRSGFRLQGLPVSAAGLSPRALYVAAGVSNSLVAMRPDGHQAWSHHAGGRVVAIAWAPDGLRIAYVVRTRHRLVLRTIWGNGTHDHVIERSVRAVRPSWRADSLAFAYVGAGGKAIVYDLFHRTRSVVTGSPQDVSQVAFAPTGTKLAVLGSHKALVGKTRFTTRFELRGIGWFGRALALVGRRGQLRPVELAGRVESFAASGKTFAALLTGRSTRIVAGTAGQYTTVLSLPRRARVASIDVSG